MALIDVEDKYIDNKHHVNITLYNTDVLNILSNKKMKIRVEQW